VSRSLYIYVVKIILKSYETLRIIAYMYALQLTFKATHFIDLGSTTIVY
jgi:hypothetical protein